MGNIWFSRAPRLGIRSGRSAAGSIANDPNELQMRYDLYRIPFNGGKGGVAEAIAALRPTP